MLHGRSNLRTCYLAGPAKRCVLGEDASGMRIATLLLRRGGLRASFGYRSRLVFGGSLMRSPLPIVILIALFSR
jgi:hypothetical protein